ncbi:MAG: CTP synthase [Rhodobacteraceae bacterium]|nr:CTP synthase [Paracoccaceae bacterium]MAY47639.1 CTP synthase [Paracoccaceae bacterium]
MSLTLVHHDTPCPARDGMLAGILAAEAGATFLTLDTGGAGLGAYEACQHVLASGALVANGLFWSEWASGHHVPAALPPTVIAGRLTGPVVVPVNPAIPAQVDMARRLSRKAAQTGRDIRQITVHPRDDGWSLTGDTVPGIATDWTTDPFGRPVPAGLSRPTPARAVRILVVGSEPRQRHTYPAVLAALGDAADACNLGLSLHFWDPAEDRDGSLPRDIDTVQGIVLPGGADMDQVAGQIRVARRAIETDTPLLGLCLGMQTLATAVAQARAGLNDANMEEVAPDAATKVFRRLTDTEVPGGFRVGLRRMRPVPGSRLARILGAGDGPVPIPVNHRYVLDPALHAPLEDAGLRISAWQEASSLADAVELRGQRFCIGLQGHPELLTRRGAAHPLFRAFLNALDG